jgi:peptide/nickel transport system ATP-binding protein
LNDRRRVLDIVADPLRIHGIPTKSTVASTPSIRDHVTSWLTGTDPNVRRAQQAMVLHTLKLVGLRPEHLLVTPQKLSGGQRQRVAIARALVARPRLLFLDEPTSALDVSVQASVVALLKEVREQNPRLAYLLVTHDLALARQLADRIAILDQGRLVEIGVTDQVLQSPASIVAQRLLEVAQTARSMPDDLR